MSRFNAVPFRQRQRGAALIVGLIMLVLITIMVTSTFKLSTSQLQAVGNMQFRGEALAAGNRAIEQIVSSPFTESPQAEQVLVDINNDGATDYRVNFAAPVCVSGSLAVTSSVPPSSTSLGNAFNTATANYFETVWDLSANVEDINSSGATVQIHQGVRVLLPESQYNTVCS
jgi:Tfp pilus assembly protein PilX